MRKSEEPRAPIEQSIMDHDGILRIRSPMYYVCCRQ